MKQGHQNTGLYSLEKKISWLLFVCQKLLIFEVQSIPIFYGVSMRMGLEIVVVRDATTGRKGLRVWPFFQGTDAQKMYAAAVLAIGLFFAVILLIT
jgi:hypothetical protein